MTALLAAILVLGVLSFWEATTPDPWRLDKERRLNIRNTARWLLVVDALVLVVGIALTPHLEWIDGDLLGIVIATVALTGLLLVLFHARNLASRIPNRLLARCTLVTAIGSAIVAYLGLADISGLIGWVYYDLLDSPDIGVSYYQLTDYAGIVVVGGTIICVPVTIILLLWYWLDLRRQANIARQTWAKVSHRSCE